MTRSPQQIPLHYLFAHNAWATEQLLSFCEGLSERQMSATAPGAVGNLFETLRHLVQAECGYFSRLTSGKLPPHWQPYLERDFAVVRARAKELEGLWLAYAASDPDAGELRSKQWPDVLHTFPAGMEITQAISHSHAHREQACTIITSLSLEPPDISGLAWGDAMGMLQRQFP